MKEEKGNGFGIASLVLGILGIVMFFGFGIVFAILALVFAIVQRKSYKNGIATAGLVLGIIGIVINSIYIIFIIVLFATFFSSEEFVNLNSGEFDFVKVNPPFSGVSAGIYGEGDSIWINLQNNGANDLIVTYLGTQGTRLSSGQDCEYDGDVLIVSGESRKIDLAGSNCYFDNEETYIADILVKYSIDGQNLELTTTGTLQETAL